MQESLENRVAAIEQRNSRVETDKAWETSWTRRLSIAVMTYVVIGLMLTLINADRPWMGAVIPTLGFLLSTLSLPVIKEKWAQHKSNG